MSKVISLAWFVCQSACMAYKLMWWWKDIPNCKQKPTCFSYSTQSTLCACSTNDLVGYVRALSCSVVFWSATCHTHSAHAHTAKNVDSKYKQIHFMYCNSVHNHRHHCHCYYCCCYLIRCFMRVYSLNFINCALFWIKNVYSKLSHTHTIARECMRLCWCMYNTENLFKVLHLFHPQPHPIHLFSFPLSARVCVRACASMFLVLLFSRIWVKVKQYANLNQKLYVKKVY